MDCIEQRHPELFAHLFEYQIYLEIVLAGCLMTLFSNNLSFSESTHILTMFMLEGESFMQELIVNIYINMSDKIIGFKDQFEI